MTLQILIFIPWKVFLCFTTGIVLFSLFFFKANIYKMPFKSLMCSLNFCFWRNGGLYMVKIVEWNTHFTTLGSIAECIHEYRNSNLQIVEINKADMVYLVTQIRHFVSCYFVSSLSCRGSLCCAPQRHPHAQLMLNSF